MRSFVCAESGVVFGYFYGNVNLTPNKFKQKRPVLVNEVHCVKHVDD